jgi:hypothetical protein
MICKVYEVGPLIYTPNVGARCAPSPSLPISPWSKGSSITSSWSFVADKPPPPRVAYQEVLMAAEAGGEYFS